MSFCHSNFGFFTEQEHRKITGKFYLLVGAVWFQIFLAYLSATRRRLLLSSTEIKHGQREEWKLNIFGWLYSHTQTVVVGSLDPHARTEKKCNLFLFNFLKLEKIVIFTNFWWSKVIPASPPLIESVGNCYMAGAKKKKSNHRLMSSKWLGKSSKNFILLSGDSFHSFARWRIVL